MSKERWDEIMFFPPTIKFKGTYRPYQQRILDKASSFLGTKKIHIVAAPGSGKTTLGIELILRADAPCLILTPNITIREQWIQRFKQDFMPSFDAIERFISRDLKIKAPIICITYQALYSAYKKMTLPMDDNQIHDYTDFDLDNALKNYQIQTICLDECHHLRNEWWKALESVIKKLDNPITISLTATPPYDATDTEWKRYINLCGPIDEEIFVPELVNDHTLCYHQDYVYFNYPTEDEEKSLKKFYDNAQRTFQKYEHHPTLIKIIQENKFYKKYSSFRQKYYQNGAYYRALILFLHHNHIKIPLFVKLSCDIEPFSMKHLEILLQNILFEDESSYFDTSFLTSLKKELVALRLINKRTVHLINDERCDKILIESKSKLDSIVKIVHSEINNLNADLRMLILADYIKKETKSSINHLEKDISSIGIIPIFETLRRENIKNINLCLLTGSLILLPNDCLEKLKHELSSLIVFNAKEVNKTHYCEITFSSTCQKEMIQAITKLFEKGAFQIVIGTKSLLGEGWDAPCINSLILASYIGSYITSNQTRGRAIRSHHSSSKISNIWHLVTINPFDSENNADYDLMHKRFESFLGIDLQEYKIENGVNRVIEKSLPATINDITQHNDFILQEASNRNKTKEKWKYCLHHTQAVDQVKNELLFDKNYFQHTYSFYNTLIQILLTTFLFFNIYEMFYYLELQKFIPLLLYIIALIILGSYFVRLVLRFLRLITKKKKMYFIAEALLAALKDLFIVTSPSIEIKVEKQDHYLSCYLKNASTYEQNIFNESFLQLFAFPDSPRYLLCRPKGIFRKEYYVVPDVFKKNKEKALIFAKRMNQNFGLHTLYFTKSDNFKGIVLQARIIYLLRYKKLHHYQKRSLIIKK